MKDMEKKKRKEKEKRRKRLNARIERGVYFLAVLVCIVFSVLDVMEKKEIEMPWKNRRS